jgi:hypothetical protein
VRLSERAHDRLPGGKKVGSSGWVPSGLPPVAPSEAARARAVADEPDPLADVPWGGG